MKKKNKFGDDTLSIHAGQKPDVEFGARAQPIYWTSSFVFDDTDSAASLFNMERAGHVYSRISNPTVSALEERIASLESGVGSIVTSLASSSPTRSTRSEAEIEPTSLTVKAAAASNTTLGVSAVDEA